MDRFSKRYTHPYLCVFVTELLDPSLFRILGGGLWFSAFPRVLGKAQRDSGDGGGGHGRTQKSPRSGPSGRLVSRPRDGPAGLGYSDTRTEALL